MRIVRGHAEARWMPSRHNLAIFRLLAYFRLRAAPCQPSDTILIIDRHQSSAETSIVAAYLVATVTLCLAGTLFAAQPLAIALTVSLVLASLGIQVTLVASGVLMTLWQAVTRLNTPGPRVNSIVAMTMIGALCAYCTTRATWVRFAGWQFFAVAAVNALAAVVAFLLRRRIAELEASIGGVPSAH